jgi:small subunit ribosomal protein S15
MTVYAVSCTGPVTMAAKHATFSKEKGTKMDSITKQGIIKKYARKEGDTGSPEVQIAVLSHRINELTDHLRSNKKDHSTRHGLLAMVSRRRKLMSYLRKEDLAGFTKLTDELGIRHK